MTHISNIVVLIACVPNTKIINRLKAINAAFELSKTKERKEKISVVYKIKTRERDREMRELNSFKIPL